MKTKNKISPLTEENLNKLFEDKESLQIFLDFEGDTDGTTTTDSSTKFSGKKRSLAEFNSDEEDSMSITDSVEEESFEPNAKKPRAENNSETPTKEESPMKVDSPENEELPVMQVQTPPFSGFQPRIHNSGYISTPGTEEDSAFNTPTSYNSPMSTGSLGSIGFSSLALAFASPNRTDNPMPLRHILGGLYEEDQRPIAPMFDGLDLDFLPEFLGDCA